MSNRPASPRDYVVEYAATHDWPEVWPRVMQARASLLAEFVDVAEELAVHKPESGEGEDAWSILQVLQHVLTYTRNVTAIVEGTARGQTIVKDPPGAIHDVGASSLRQLLAATVAASAELAGVTERLPVEPDLSVTVDHPSFGPFNSREWFLFLSVHDDVHRQQIAALKEHA